MPALQSPRLCVLFALPDEAAALVPRMRFADLVPTLPQLLNGHVAGTLNGYTLSVSCSGVGMKNASRHLNYIIQMAHGNVLSPRLAKEARIEQIPICRLLICGFAGGLSPDLTPGDLVVADRVITPINDVRNFKTLTPDLALRALAESVSVSHIRRKPGTLFTGTAVVTTVAEKRALAERTGAIAVDMETAGAAQTAEMHGIPYLIVRAITDGLNDTLPLDFNALADADGNVNRGRVLRATLMHPWKIPALIRLGQRSSLATRHLADFIEAYLAALPETDA